MTTTSTPKTTSTDGLPRLLEQRLVCLQKLLYASERQQHLVSLGNLDAILGHLAQKQLLMDDLLEVERLLDPYRGVTPETREWKSPEERSLCQAMIAEGETLLATILRQDQESESSMKRQHDDLEEQIRKLGRGTTAAVAYSRQNNVLPSRETMTLLDLSH